MRNIKDLRLDKCYRVQFEYLLDCINTEQIGEDATDKEKINFVFKTFEDEYGNPYNKRIYPKECERLAQYLRGLPSCINIAFTDYDIIQIGKRWGFCRSSIAGTRFVKNWFGESALRLIQMRDILND